MHSGTSRTTPDLGPDPTPNESYLPCAFEITAIFFFTQHYTRSFMCFEEVLMKCIMEKPLHTLPSSAQSCYIKHEGE